MRDVAQFFKVLSDEARLKILWLLFNHRELCVCDIMGALGITQSKASRHLITMKHAGLVNDRREGTWSYYSLSADVAGFERTMLATLRKSLGAHDGATGALRNLQTWLQKKECAGACAPRGGKGGKR
ncbi:MAG: metalloregulator ArsR/SmtB family transcription factor [Proteobacteria bacterium]|jgi:ArsR family transcriptional regulator|nr:metalloregulator ArsR/SmtB family transcription factor [Pseudomonadota bacterium]